MPDGQSLGLSAAGSSVIYQLGRAIGAAAPCRRLKNGFQFFCFFVFCHIWGAIAQMEHLTRVMSTPTRPRVKRGSVFPPPP